MRTDRNGLLFIARREALVLVAYPDGGNHSIGFGSNDASLKPGDTITAEEAFKRLMRDVSEREDDLAKLLKREVNQHQWNAFMSLFYQSGNRYAPALAHFWNYKEDGLLLDVWRLCAYSAGGEWLAGLEKRRRSEWRVFEKGDYGELSPIPMWRGNPRTTQQELYHVKDSDLAL